VAIVILDGGLGGALPPYPAWLRDSGRELVLLTGDSAGGQPAGYATVRRFADYARSAEVDRAVLDLAGRPLSAVVATAPADLIRAAALREHLDLPGQHREDAITFADGVALRQVLAWSGVPVVPVEPVDRVADVYLSASRWGYPVHVRRRRYGWSSVRVLADEAATRSFTQGGLFGSRRWLASLMVEPFSIGAVGRVAGVLDDTGWQLFAVVEQDPALLAVARAALSALPAQAHHPYVVDLCRGENDEWLVDTVGCAMAGDPVSALLGRALRTDVHRDMVRAQAGLPGASREAGP